MAHIWQQNGSQFVHGSRSEYHDILPPGIYNLEFNPMLGFSLNRIMDKFTFDGELYDLETDFITRALKFWEHTNKNFGILLNGVRGTGKSITAKQIANALNLPVILITKDEEGLPEYLSEINQDACFFLDEYEKNFSDSDSLLSVLDGTLSNAYKKMWILTTNTTYISENLKERPGRIRYIKDYGNLSEEQINKILSRTLNDLSRAQEVLDFIVGLNIITVDIVKEIVEEINFFNGPIKDFENIFNTTKSKRKVDIYLLDENGKFIDDLPVFKGLNWKHQDWEPFDNFYINGTYIGDIGEVYSENHLKIKLCVPHRPDQKFVINQMLKLLEKPLINEENISRDFEQQVYLQIVPKIDYTQFQYLI